jgi:ribose transport system ATP-binding protein
MVGRGLQTEYYKEGRQRRRRLRSFSMPPGLGAAGAFHHVDLQDPCRRNRRHCRRGRLRPRGGDARASAASCRRRSGTLKIKGEAVHFTVAGTGRAQEHRLCPARTPGRGTGDVPVNRREHHARRSLGSDEERPIDYRRERRLAIDWIKRLRIKAPGPDIACRKLSGGNQQKVVLARWMTAGSRILILDHPTRGLDVGAKEEVYELVRDLSAQGVAILLISDTLEETIGLSHRVLVMRDGEVTARFDAAPAKSPTRSISSGKWCEEQRR